MTRGEAVGDVVFFITIEVLIISEQHCLSSSIHDGEFYNSTDSQRENTTFCTTSDEIAKCVPPSTLLPP